MSDFSDWKIRGAITRHAPAAECPLCAALVVWDATAMTAHTEWHADRDGGPT